MMKSRKKELIMCDPRKTNYLVLLLLILSVMAIIITYRLTERGCFSPELLTNPVGGSAVLNANYSVNKLISLVDDAVKSIKQNSPKAFKDFRIQGGTWRAGSMYIFVYDMNGNTVVLPPQQNLEGTNRLSVQDSNGVYFVKEMINSLQRGNSGWIQYSYPKPGEEIPSEKLSYFQKVQVGNKIYVVGSGIYLQ